MTTSKPKLYEVVGERLRLNQHEGQLRAWDSLRRFVAAIAGTQGGKTEWAMLWLWREIMNCGPGDYAIGSPTFTLMGLKVLPTFKTLFQTVLGLGTYVQSPIRQFRVSPEGARRLFPGVTEDQLITTPTNVFFGYAENPDSLESATLKAAVLDEAGQVAFKRESWEAILRRLAIHQGRACIPTTPYFSGGWLKTEIFDRFKAGDPTVDLIQFSSLMNPAFPKEEYERARRDLPQWKFDLFYRGMLARPPGQIYACFDEKVHVVPSFGLNPKWQRYLGIDFGGVNTAGVFFAEEPGTKRWFAYRTYQAGERTSREHVQALLEGEVMLPIAFGGSGSEGQWRSEFSNAGLPVREPDVSADDSTDSRNAKTSVELGIDRVFGAIKRNEIYVFADLRSLIDDFQSYSRELDSQGEPTEKIADKDTWHKLDAVRYIVGSVKKQGGGGIVETSGPRLEEFGIAPLGGVVGFEVDRGDREDRPWYERL